MIEKFRVVEFPKGHYGYKSWYELQRYNPVYKKWYCVKGAIELQFIMDYCLLNNINQAGLTLSCNS